MVIPDKLIINTLENVLSNTKYRLISFQRNHENFGNIEVVIKKGIKKYRFVTDRGDIYCNDNLIKQHGYHIAGKDDLPDNLVHSIKKHLL